MAIRFVCSCGKHLRARDEMAGRRSMCPRCGAPVGVPAPRRPPPGAPAGLLTPVERCRTRRVVLPVDEVHEQVRTAVAPQAPLGWQAASVAEVSPAPRRQVAGQLRRPRERHVAEIATGEYLLYPVRALRPLLGLALLLSATTAGTVQVWQRLPDLEVDTATAWLLYMASLGVPFSALAAAGAFLDGVLAANASGQVRDVPRRRYLLESALPSVARWGFAFLTGPVAILALAWSYWLSCGDPLLVDRIILANMIAAAAGYWLLAVAAGGRGDGLLDANPVRVAELVEQLGGRAVALGAAVGLIAVSAGWLILRGIDILSERSARGLVLLLAGWVLGLTGATFLMTLLGMWCYRKGI